ncbi:MAG: hypothetical protein EBX40_07455, partial [Gammaproteobacteria bacterium]|nr:hypothetical protein [Gammaproteobacteria bacterium]
AKPGVDYIRSRGLTLEGDMYYDIDREGIVFPYYYENYFVGAQTRFIVPKMLSDGEVQKMDTLPGTRLGLLFYGYSGGKFVHDYKGVIATEGAFNCLSIRQALNSAYGGVLNNPWLVVACSGSGATKYHQETLKEFKDSGLKVICAFDSDEAGFKGLKKLNEAGSITHYAITGDTSVDWNDKLKSIGHIELAKWFLRQVKKV